MQILKTVLMRAFLMIYVSSFDSDDECKSSSSVCRAFTVLSSVCSDWHMTLTRRPRSPTGQRVKTQLKKLIERELLVFTVITAGLVVAGTGALRCSLKQWHWTIGYLFLSPGYGGGLAGIAEFAGLENDGLENDGVEQECIRLLLFYSVIFRSCKFQSPVWHSGNVVGRINEVYSEPVSTGMGDRLLMSIPLLGSPQTEAPNTGVLR